MTTQTPLLTGGTLYPNMAEQDLSDGFSANESTTSAPSTILPPETYLIVVPDNLIPDTEEARYIMSMTEDMEDGEDPEVLAELREALDDPDPGTPWRDAFREGE